LQKLERRAKKCIELRGEYVEEIPSLVAVACFLPGRAKDVSEALMCNTYRLSLFHCNNGYANALQCYVIRTLFLFSVTLGGTYSNHWALKV